MEYKDYAQEGCQKYRDFQPTGFDPKGAFIHDERADWLVLPVMQTRDSNHMEESNFDAALDIMSGEGENVEVHRFGHWACGFFEIIIFNPASDFLLEKAGEIVCTLANYPIINDEDYSRRVYEDMLETWERSSLRDRIFYCQRAGINFLKARHDKIPGDITQEVMDIE